MDVWTFVWLMLILKIPIVALFLIVRWAVKATPEEAMGDGQDGGIGTRPRPDHPYHPRPRLPHAPRRGPHRSPLPGPPARVRTAVAMKRLSCN